MKTEARLFFREMLKEDRPVPQFLHADHTFVDKKLAKLYGLPEQNTLQLADGFRKVSVEGNKHRGGLLGMAAVLTVSANGVETSPVIRGAWVSENILGVKPPPWGISLVESPQTPLIIACRLNSTEMCHLLVAHGAQVNASDAERG